MKIIKTVAMSREMAEWLEQEAKRQNRTVSNLVETVLKAAAERDGEVTPESVE